MFAVTRLLTRFRLQHGGVPWTQSTVLITNFSVFEIFQSNFSQTMCYFWKLITYNICERNKTSEKGSNFYVLICFANLSFAWNMWKLNTWKNPVLQYVVSDKLLWKKINNKYPKIHKIVTKPLHDKKLRMTRSSISCHKYFIFAVFVWMQYIKNSENSMKWTQDRSYESHYSCTQNVNKHIEATSDIYVKASFSGHNITLIKMVVYPS